MYWLSIIGIFLGVVAVIFIALALFGRLQIMYFWDRESSLGCVDILLNGKISLLKVKTLECGGDIWYQVGGRELTKIEQNNPKIATINKKFCNNKYAKDEQCNLKKSKKHIKVGKVVQDWLPFKQASSTMNVFYNNIDCLECGMVIGLSELYRQLYAKIAGKIFAGENRFELISSFDNTNQLKINGRVDIKYGGIQIIFRVLRMLIFRRRYYG